MCRTVNENYEWARKTSRFLRYTEPDEGLSILLEGLWLWEKNGDHSGSPRDFAMRVARNTASNAHRARVAGKRGGGLKEATLVSENQSVDQRNEFVVMDRADAVRWVRSEVSNPKTLELIDRILEGDTIKDAARKCGLMAATAQKRLKAIGQRLGARYRGEDC